MKRLLIKACGIAPPLKIKGGYISGVGRSTTLLLQALAQQKEIPFEIQIYTSGISSIGFNFNHLPFKHFSFPIPESIGCEKTMIEPYFRARCLKYDLLHIPHNLDRVYNNERFIVTLHDTIGFDTALKQGNIKMMNKWHEMANRSVGIITCSEFSKNEIMNKLSVPEEKINVIHWGISYDNFHVESPEKLNKQLENLHINYPYFLAVSCSHPRKNIPFLLKAFSLFKSRYNTNFKLIVIWSNPPQEIIDKYQIDINKENIIFKKYVSDEDLLSLYNGATATIYPSLAEGFGFPILESFACETPVITCRNTSLPEIGQDAAIYTSETDIEEMVEKLCLFAENSFNIDEFKIKSQKVLSMFSWQKTAEQYINCYKKYL